MCHDATSSSPLWWLRRTAFLSPLPFVAVPATQPRRDILVPSLSAPRSSQIGAEGGLLLADAHQIPVVHHGAEFWRDDQGFVI
jgi:hypothetical protein